MSVFEGEMLGNVKNRLNEIADLIDQHYEKVTTYKNELIYAQGEAEKADSDLNNTKRRYQLLEEDLKFSQGRLETHEKKLKELEESTEKIEQERDKLEEAEGELDDSIDELEVKKNDMKREVERSEFSLSSEQRRKVVIERDLGRLKEKADGLEQRAKILEETLEKAGQSLMECEQREEEALDREDLNEEKIEFLEGELHETDIRADIAERACQTVERGIIEVENEMNHWKRKVEALAAELTAMDEVVKIEQDIDENEMKRAKEGTNGKVEAEIKTD